jgi:hypothetical protein
MTDHLFAGKAALALILAAFAAACSSGGGQRPLASTPGPATSQTEIETIAALLDNGERSKAKRRLSALLKRDALNPSLLVLRDSITRAPDELLGPTSFTYTTRPGDTMSQLAQRFLGNRLKSYQLARYNGIEKPIALEPGRILRIPRQPAQAAPAPAPRAVAKPVAPPRAQAATMRPKPPAKAAAPAGNPTAAGKARSAGLAALNQGKPEHAVALLSRAATLDPANPAIARDLARAKRIAATVRAQN